MAKDPAFLFYPGDFITGTQFFSDEQIGKYIRLLCAQHQHGHLTVIQVQKVCGGITDADVLDKFLVDNDGKFYNERLDNEIERRKKHSDKQKANSAMRWHKNGISQNDAVEMPLETITEIETKNELKGVQGENLLIPQMLKTFQIQNKDYPADESKDYPALLSIAEFICKNLKIKLDLNDENCIKSILDNWGKICEYTYKDKFFKNYNITQTEKYIQSIILNIQNGQPGSKARDKESAYREYANRRG
jgi:uncharacterized protein YdaU (DUF1376 family)